MSAAYASIPIRYDGLEADSHQMELNALGESLQGVARILATAGHFSVTGQYAKQMQAMDVRVYVSEGKENCFSLTAVMTAVKDYQIFAGVAGVVLGPLIGWIIARASNNKEEMKLLKASLDHAISELAGQNKDLIPKYLATVERIAESLRPAARAAVAPIGNTCTSMTIGTGAGNSVVIDEARAEAIRSAEPDELTEEKTWSVFLTELDREGWTAKVRFSDEDEMVDGKRYKAIISDPALGVLGNPYIRAFANGSLLKVRAKAALKDGDIHTLYVSDTEKPASG